MTSPEKALEIDPLEAMSQKPLPILLKQLKEKIEEGAPLLRDEIVFLVQHCVQEDSSSGQYTAIGAARKQKIAFVEVLSAQDTVDAILQAESKYQDASVHIVFQGCLPYTFSYAGF